MDVLTIKLFFEQFAEAEALAFDVDNIPDLECRNFSPISHGRNLQNYMKR